MKNKYLYIILGCLVILGVFILVRSKGNPNSSAAQTGGCSLSQCSVQELRNYRGQLQGQIAFRTQTGLSTTELKQTLSGVDSEIAKRGGSGGGSPTNNYFQSFDYSQLFPQSGQSSGQTVTNTTDNLIEKKRYEDKPVGAPDPKAVSAQGKTKKTTKKAPTAQQKKAIATIASSIPDSIVSEGQTISLVQGKPGQTSQNTTAQSSAGITRTSAQAIKDKDIVDLLHGANSYVFTKSAIESKLKEISFSKEGKADLIALRDSTSDTVLHDAITKELGNRFLQDFRNAFGGGNANADDCDFPTSVAGCGTRTSANPSPSGTSTGSGITSVPKPSPIGSPLDGANRPPSAGQLGGTIGDSNRTAGSLNSPELRRTVANQGLNNLRNDIRNGVVTKDNFSSAAYGAPSGFNYGQTERYFQNVAKNPGGNYESASANRDTFSKVSCGFRSAFSFLGLGCK